MGDADRVEVESGIGGCQICRGIREVPQVKTHYGMPHGNRQPIRDWSVMQKNVEKGGVSSPNEPSNVKLGSEQTVTSGVPEPFSNPFRVLRQSRKCRPTCRANGRT